MISETTPRFRRAYAALPPQVQRRAQKAYRLWAQNPRHPSLHFKKIGKVWSARVDDNHRALAHLIGDTAHWFWIGSHEEYEMVIRQIQKKGSVTD